MRRAVFGARSSSALIAPDVASRARSSSTWPSSTSTVMTAARFEIDRDRSVMAAEGGRKQCRREGRDDAVEPGDAGAQRDQREHVEVARDERLPAALEERPAGPQHHRCRQRELDQVRPAAAA